MAQGRIDVLYLLLSLRCSVFNSYPNRASGCRGRARPGGLGAAAMRSTGCRVATSSTLRGACAEGNREAVQCGEHRWQPGMRS